MNPQNYTINIRPGWGISPVVKVSQGDVGRPLAFTIMDGQDAITLSGTATVKITGTKPSGLGFTQDCTLSGNTASIDTVATMTQEAGSVPAELIVTDGSTVIGTANFVMYVEPAAHPEGTTDGDAETARDLMTRAQAAVEQAEAEADRAEDAAESVSQTGISTVGATAGQVPTANGAGGWTWEDPQGAGGGTSDDIENKSTVSGATVTNALTSLSDQIANLEGGAPTPAATVSAMVDTTKIYLYVGSESGYTAGHWYYYNGSAWVDGGAYGEAASMSAGVKEALLACFRKVAWIDENGQTYYNNLYNALYPPANLVSITAVYTQSGTVYDTSSLDDLKPDLVVTANYSDGTSETVTTYMLSGTLAVGTSTITVAYGGKTTTFNVAVEEEWGTDYTWLYKASDGALLSARTDLVTPTIGTGCTETLDDGLLHLFVPSQSSAIIRYRLAQNTNTNAKLTAKVKFGSIPYSSAGNGLRLQISNGTNGAQIYENWDNGSSWNFGTYEGTTYTNQIALELDTWYIISIERNNGKQIVAVDGTEILNSSTLSTNYCTSNAIFAQSEAHSTTGLSVDIEWLTYKNND